MTFPDIETERFIPERGFRLIVQAPEPSAPEILDAIRSIAPLTYGDYDAVAFTTQPGTQHFRALGHGRNRATKDVVTVPCVEVSVFLPEEPSLAGRVIEAVYHAHPYEEPVIFLEPCLRTCHIRGLDEDNPNRFWNKPAEDWIPPEHRS